VELAQVVVVDRDEPHLAEPFALHAVVYDIAEAVEGGALGQLLLGFLDSSGNAEAKATAFIYFNLNHNTLLFGLMFSYCS
jgi:hypothetical protein